MAAHRQKNAPMPAPRRDGHGIRIPEDLWILMALRAHEERRSRTSWAQAVLDAAAHGRLLRVPRPLMRRLTRWAKREGISMQELGLRLLEDCAARAEQHARPGRNG
jgi:hypothetical protein